MAIQLEQGQLEEAEAQGEVEVVEVLERKALQVLVEVVRRLASSVQELVVQQGPMLEVVAVP